MQCLGEPLILHMVIYFKLSYLDRTKMIILGVMCKNNKCISFGGSSVMWLLINKYTHTPSIQKLIYSEYRMHLQRAELYVTLEERQSQTKRRQPGNTSRCVTDGELEWGVLHWKQSFSTQVQGGN